MFTHFVVLKEEVQGHACLARLFSWNWKPDWVHSRAQNQVEVGLAGLDCSEKLGLPFPHFQQKPATNKPKTTYLRISIASMKEDLNFI